jgi:YidC/Oxa1 family membrane protein insertase
MFDRKTILYILFGITAFMLYEAWQKDYRVVSETSKQITVESSELPTGSNILKDTIAGTKIEQKEAANHRTKETIRVTTDVLDIVINLDGGNIEEAHLIRYPKAMGKNEPIKLLSINDERFYIARSNLIDSSKSDSKQQLIRYSSLNQHYKLDGDHDDLRVELQGVRGGIKVNKVYTFFRDRYDVHIDYELKNRSSSPWHGNFYAEIKRKDFDGSSGIFQISTYTGAAVSSPEKPYEKISFSDIEDIAKKRGGIIRNTKEGWIAMQQRYFLSAWIPEPDKEYKYFASVNDGVYGIGFIGETITLAPGDKHIISSALYMGPEIAENLAPLAKGLERTVDYGWLWIIAVGLFWILKRLHGIVGNWGVAIILITLLIKLVFYKLSESSGRSMAKMKELMPKLQALKERYGGDRQALHQATMDLYKREGVNPMNLGGCLPMLIQIPFFIALYYVLVNAVELRQAPFMLWIQDLSAQDPFYVLPVLMGVSMLLQQKLSPSSLDPTQAKIMMIMPVVFTFLFATFPAGLVLYWLVNNVLSILQQWYINRCLEREAKTPRKK